MEVENTSKANSPSPNWWWVSANCGILETASSRINPALFFICRCQMRSANGRSLSSVSFSRWGWNTLDHSHPSGAAQGHLHELGWKRAKFSWFCWENTVFTSLVSSWWGDVDSWKRKRSKRTKATFSAAEYQDVSERAGNWRFCDNPQCYRERKFSFRSFWWWELFQDIMWAGCDKCTQTTSRHLTTFCQRQGPVAQLQNVDFSFLFWPGRSLYTKTLGSSKTMVSVSNVKANPRIVILTVRPFNHNSTWGLLLLLPLVIRPKCGVKFISIYNPPAQLYPLSPNW